LIFPFAIELALLDIEATDAVGYDPDFKETVLTSTDDKIGESSRSEILIKVPGQFADQSQFLAAQEAPTGDLGQASFVILFHFRDLERLDLVEPATGNAKIKIGDRVNGIYDIKTDALVQAVRNPPGAYVTKAVPRFGLGSRRNLLEVTFRSRDPGTP
jgi:hypothetical protein